MSEYDVEYVYVKGEDNVLADGMSRILVIAISVSNPTGNWEDVAIAGEFRKDQRNGVNIQGSDIRGTPLGSRERKLKSREGIGDRKEDYSRENSGSGHNLQCLGERNNGTRRHNENKDKEGENQKEDRIEESMRKWGR